MVQMLKVCVTFLRLDRTLCVGVVSPADTLLGVCCGWLRMISVPATVMVQRLAKNGEAPSRPVRMKI